MKAVAFVLACFGGLTLLLALSRWLARRRWASLGHLLLGGGLLVAAAWLWPLAQELATYAPLRLNQPVAQIFSEQTGSHTFRVTLTRLPAGRMQIFEVAGDEWQLDARTLRWRDRAAQLGLQPLLRLDRLSTRFVRPPDAAATRPSSYALAVTTGDDVWAQARTSAGWSDQALAGHAGSAWRPLVQGARWLIWYDGTALQARPANDAAESRPRAP